VDIDCLDQKYSTTRRVSKERPVIEKKPKDKFEAVLLLPEGEERKGEGGLRTQRYFKSNLPDSSLITVITVVYNGEQFLEQTIQSVINQNYDNVEYIIIDGGSTDNTLDIIRQYEHAIDYWVSEKDFGIYDAMNKGINLATGRWINFMNSGDYFYNKDILKSIFIKQSIQDYQIIYGNQEVRYTSGLKKMVQAGHVENLWKCSQFCHQAAFVNSQYHKAHLFNLNTKIVADFEFFYLAWANGVKFKPIAETVCSFDVGGVSNGGSMKVFWEIAKIQVQYGIRGKSIAYCGAIYSKFKWFIRRIIWK
jgi:glycosyltransferase involved in cell wall biosynthesis